MSTNSIIIQLAQFIPVAQAVLEPTLLVFIILSIFLVRPNMGGTTAQQMKGVAYFVIQAIATGLLTIGALPPFIAVISAQQMQPEWYVAFLFTFISGGLLFVWVDNHIRNLPSESYSYVQTMFYNCLYITGLLSVTLSLISIGVATIYQQLQLPGFWAIPATLVAYGFLLCWLVTEQKKVTTTKKNIVKKVIIAQNETTKK
jgi:hypothetical protein